MARILIVEDDIEWCNLWQMVAKSLKHEAVCVHTLFDAEHKVAEGGWDAVITDFMYPQRPGEKEYPSGADFIMFLRDMAPETPFLLYSGSDKREIAAILAERDITLKDGEFVRKDHRFDMTASFKALIARIP